MIYVKDILTDVVEIFNKSNGTCECIVLHLKSINLVTAVFYKNLIQKLISFYLY